LSVWRPGQDGAERCKLVICDPDDAARREARDQLQAARGIAVAADVADGVEALDLIAHFRPDVVILELEVPPLDGSALIQRSIGAYPEARVLIHTSTEDIGAQLEAFRAGALGLVRKGSKRGVLPRAVRSLLDGTAVVPRDLETAMVDLLWSLPPVGNGMRPVRSALTQREWEIADLMAQGMSTKEIAAHLTLSEDTIYTHVKHILSKLGVHTRQEAVEVANRLRQPGS
jgi:two-component system nitrate/nitrite response regulator NarL